MRLIIPLTTALALTAIVLPAVVAGEALVELELATEKNFPLTGTHRWMEALKGLKVSSLRIRTARAGDRPQVTKGGTESTPIYHVTGMLTSGNKLVLPGGSFSIGDRGRIAAWIEKVRSGGGGDEPGSRPAAFGLTGKQLVEVHQSLAVPVTDATKGQSPKAVVREIAGAIDLPIVIDPAVMRAFGGDEKVAEEMKGLSAGTTLAAVLRPLGLVMAPQKTSSGIKLLVTDSRKAPESWPIGWPPEKKEREVLPKLFEFLTVEIEDTILTDALSAIEGRFEVPFLFDHNSMARHRIEPAKTKVALPRTKTYYKRVVDRLLFQAKLKAELRVDEAGNPLIWISTLKR